MPMSRSIRLAAFLALGTVTLAGSATVAPAANPYGTTAEIQRCAENLRWSGRHGGGDDEVGTTEYDVLVGRCMSQFYRQRGGR